MPSTGTEASQRFPADASTPPPVHHWQQRHLSLETEGSLSNRTRRWASYYSPASLANEAGLLSLDGRDRLAPEPMRGAFAVRAMPHVIVSASIAVGFALIHVWGPRLRFLRVTPRSIWLSAAGGVSVAYVFVHLLPELAESQETFTRQLTGAPPWISLDRHSYLIALFGLAVFYGLDRAARQSARAEGKAGRERRPTETLFWIHLGAFALYNLLVGYLLVHREESDLGGLLAYGFAMGLHFLVNDQGLRDHHGETYDRKGRWMLAVAPSTGLGLGLLTAVSPLVLAAAFALLAGGVVLNVLKEELPEDRESRFSAFACGSGAYAAFLLTTG